MTWLQAGPQVEKCPSAIEFFGKYVIVIDVKLAYGLVHHGYTKITPKGMGVEEFSG